MKFTSEAYIEENLIETLLATGQWTYEKDLDTEEKLWANLRNIIERNNKSVLDDVPLTDKEFAQVKDQLIFPSFFKAAVFLRGENGKVKVRVQREDASLGDIWLLVLDNRDIGGGTSVYQIINQFRAGRQDASDGDSRFDVTLLINGLPMIHIELKNRSVGYMEAFNQIKEYAREGKFAGIYQSLQMFVVTNGTDTRYIAPAGHDKLNSKFLSRWVDKNNNPVNSYIDFARSVLTIPQAHRLVSSYTVLDYDRESLIILRPYQIHAIKAVREDLRGGSGGYVWHTTGSGKTLTSYKVASNILDVPGVDKSVFIVDRVDLDNQTSSAFLSYARGDVVSVDETDNVGDLVNKLISPGKAMVVTTVQKLNYLIKRYENKTSPKAKKLKDLNLVFVVDECHRAVSSEKQREINKFFAKTLWYGFTGTPIFVENKKAAKGDLARTTEDQYGKCLHEYNVKNAIEDKAVLGFQVEYKSTIGEDSLYDLIKASGHEDEYRLMDEIEKESYIPTEAYEREDHMVQVIDTIVNKSRLKFGLDRGSGKTFSAILTTSSIANAQAYYELFKKLKNDELDLKISKRVRESMKDFPKVAITYSIADNVEETGLNKEEMKKSLADYNETYGTSFGLDNIRAYNANLNDRLARKKSIYKSRSEQVDLVIVVDRLLTGFDSPSTAILFIDRPPMTSQNLIQAFSRTNRIYDKYKAFGQIVTFQKPYTYEQAIEEAFKLYANGGERFIQAPSFKESLALFDEAYHNFKDMVKNPSDVAKISDVKDMVAYMKAFQKLDKTLASIKVYGEFDEDYFHEVYDLSDEDLEEYAGHYNNIKEIVKEMMGNDGGVPIPIDYVDIGYESLTVSKLDIDFSYLDNLLDACNKEAQENTYDEMKISRLVKEFYDLSKKASKTNPQKAIIYENTLNDLLENPNKYKDKDMADVVGGRIYRKYEAGIDKLAKEGKISKKLAMYYAETFDKDLAANEQKAAQNLIAEADIEAIQEEYGLKNFRAKKYLRDIAYKIAKEDVAGYMT